MSARGAHDDAALLTRQSEGTIKSPYSRLKIRASPRMIESNFVSSVCNGTALPDAVKITITIAPQ